MTGARPALLALLLGYGSMAQAVEKVITIKGIVYAAMPCVINKNAPIKTSFGPVYGAQIDRSTISKTINYTLDCTRSATNELRMQILGNPALDGSALEIPGHENIGVALIKDGKRLAINTWSNFDTRKQPVLEAMLIKLDTGEIKTGEFKASATLLVDYR
ncbi:Fimbrial protein [Pseudomonas simiae]|uniref:fimbrial protein n=1 Tax=Pseudomonas simiae TaxID=321846 RepID=UPI0008E209A4|nr:fimbrial protein [Pseudomonas simiae]SFB39414.1 Fimbrial protein [Pseudomonas simiae]